MDDRKMEIIKQLMEQLESEMEPTGEDLGERLGRPKVEIEIGSHSEPGDEEAMMSDGTEGDEMPDADEELKQRIMKMRG